MQPDHVWTHVTDEQAAGRACVMCGRPTDQPGWAGVVVGLSDSGDPVYACSGGEGQIVGGDPRPAARTCADQAALVVPDSPEGLGL